MWVRTKKRGPYPAQIDWPHSLAAALVRADYSGVLQQRRRPRSARVRPPRRRTHNNRITIPLLRRQGAAGGGKGVRTHTHLVHRLDVLCAAAAGERRACERAAARRLTPGTDVASSTLAHCGQRLMPGGSSMLSVDGTVGAPDPSSTTIGSGRAPLIAAISRTVYDKLKNRSYG